GVVRCSPGVVAAAGGGRSPRARPAPTPPARRAAPRELADSPAPAAAHVEDRVALSYRDVPQPPIGPPGMADVPAPQEEPAEPSRRLSALVDQLVLAGHESSPALAAERRLSLHLGREAGRAAGPRP